MVVVKWTSAPAATLTRRRTGRLNAELNPTLPFTADETDAIGMSDDEDELREVDESWCWNEGRPCCDGRVRAGPAMIREGRRWMCGAFATFCRTKADKQDTARPYDSVR